MSMKARTMLLVGAAAVTRGKRGYAVSPAFAATTVASATTAKVVLRLSGPLASGAWSSS